MNAPVARGETSASAEPSEARQTAASGPKGSGAHQLGKAGALPSDALTDRVNAWASHALTKAKVRQVDGADYFTATLLPFRRFVGTGPSESLALDGLRQFITQHARTELVAGRDLPTWESQIPEVTEAMKCLVRLSNLRRELKCRAEEWGGKRQNLPAGAVERCLADIDAVVTRHAMQIQGVTPPQTSSP